jgi:hypothetical protein
VRRTRASFPEGAPYSDIVHRRTLLTTLAFAVLPFLFGCEGEQEDTGELTFVDMHEALRETGKVLFAEIEFSAEGDQVPSLRVWYWPNREVSRREYSPYPGEHTQTGIMTAERQVTYDKQDNNISDWPISVPLVKSPIPLAAGPLYAYFAIPPPGTNEWMTTSEANHGVATEDGRRLLHLSMTAEALQEGHDSPTGTITRFDVYFDVATKLPVRSELLVTYPDQPPPDGPEVLTFKVVDLLDPDILRADHFDPDALVGLHVTLDESIDIAARGDFPIFWLGRETQAEWTSPQGNKHTSAKLSQVHAPGVPGRSEPGSASLWYSMPPDFGGPMLIVGQSRDPLQRQPRDIDAMRTAGNVTPLMGLDGFIYAQYSERASCSFAAAQTDPACRMFGDAVYGAVVTINGTAIHLSAIRLSGGGDRAPNTNPFSNPDVLLRLVNELRPIGQ